MTVHSIAERKSLVKVEYLQMSWSLVYRISSGVSVVCGDSELESAFEIEGLSRRQTKMETLLSLISSPHGGQNMGSFKNRQQLTTTK